MLFNKKIIITLGLSSVIAVVALTSMKTDDPEYKNLNLLYLGNRSQEKRTKTTERTKTTMIGIFCPFCSFVLVFDFLFASLR